MVSSLAALSAGWGLLRFLTPRPRGEARVLVRLQREQLPAHGALVFRGERLAVLRRGGRIYALDLTCTHLGCTVNLTPENFTCPCHGSVFALDGQVLKGPAHAPLRGLPMDEDAEGLRVQGRNS